MSSFGIAITAESDGYGNGPVTVTSSPPRPRGLALPNIGPFVTVLGS